MIILPSSHGGRKLEQKPSYEAVLRFLLSLKRHSIRVENGLASLAISPSDRKQWPHDLSGEYSKADPIVALALSLPFERPPKQDGLIDFLITRHDQNQLHHQVEGYFDNAPRLLKVENVIDVLSAIVESGPRLREIMRPYVPSGVGVDTLEEAVEKLNGKVPGRKTFAEEIVRELIAGKYKTPNLSSITSWDSHPSNNFGIVDEVYEGIHRAIIQCHQTVSAML